MKYGKQYLDTLEHVPEEWRQQAIEYRKLKKVINRVANELKDLGLTSEVLKDLLNQQSPQKKDTVPLNDTRTEKKGNALRWADQPGSPSAKDEDAKDEAEASVQKVIDEAEGVVVTEDDSPEAGRVPLGAKGKGKAKATRKRRVRATYELGGTAANPEPRIHLVFSSCSSSSYSESESSDPVRDDSGDEEDSSPANFLFKRHARKRSRSMNSHKTPKAQIVDLPSSEGEEPETDPDGTGDFPEAAHSEAARLAQVDTAPKTPDDSGSGRAAGDETPETESTGSVVDGVNTDDDVEFEGAGPQANGLLRRMYGFGKRWSEDEDSPAIYELDENGQRIPETPPSEEDEEDASGGSRPLKRQLSQETIKSSLAGISLRDEPLGKVEKDEQDRKKADRAEKVKRKVEEADQADDEGDEQPVKPANGTTRRRKHRPRQHRREVYIPLNSDTEFLTLLASALNSLATLQLAQKRQFTEAVQILAREVSSVSSPSRPKTDLYIWREIFSLWVEAAIFESSRERDRGERSIEEVEKRLEWFVDQVAKRKLAKRMRNKESRVALEKFVALNVELLDLKKFQVANEEAARKILKKHDKRTALTASLGFPKFIADGDASKLISTELIHSGDDGKARPVLTLPGFPSLPHILLSTFTSTLLPIIPQLEDYECSICGDVAFKPIRLACGHKFCVRCLVKMQKRGQDNCPQCRQPVVLRANATNLDQELQQFLLRWFPHEVKEKERNNHKEAAREELEEMGLKEHKCRMM